MTGTGAYSLPEWVVILMRPGFYSGALKHMLIFQNTMTS